MKVFTSAWPRVQLSAAFLFFRRIPLFERWVAEEVAVAVGGMEALKAAVVGVALVEATSAVAVAGTRGTTARAVVVGLLLPSPRRPRWIARPCSLHCVLRGPPRVPQPPLSLRRPPYPRPK